MSSQTKLARATRVPPWVPFFNPIARRLLAAGVPIGPNVLLTVRGRKSGLPRTTPVTVVRFGGRRWLLAPFGEGDWVRNLRAAGRATIAARGRTEDVTAGELGPDDAVAFFRDVFPAAVRKYGALAAWIVRNVDKIDLDHPEAAARGCPVFELSCPRFAASED
jgi:deazaflavin-dependent oxidoreductase (nitroreductase family)